MGTRVDKDELIGTSIIDEQTWRNKRFIEDEIGRYHWHMQQFVEILVSLIVVILSIALAVKIIDVMLGSKEW